MTREVRRASRGRRLTPEEAAKYRRLRELIEQEKPLILERRRSREAITRLLAALRAAREAAGLSLADVRERTGMDRSAIAKLENGVRDNPTLDTLIRYADAVGKRLVVTLADRH